MIFLSHTSTDKPIVKQIAITLEKVYGRANIFYDEWSIQPGDSIIGKMNSGLVNCEFFFFFISENSLKSKMVELEWQSAIMQLSKKIKFIPVKLDNSLIPTLISQFLYIDLYSNGIDVAVRQMIDVIDGNNTFVPQSNFSNLAAYIHKIDSKTVHIEIKAKYYLEPHSRYLIVVENSENDFSISFPDFNEYFSGFNKSISFSDGIHNCVLAEVSSPTSPNFPVKVILNSEKENIIKILYVMHATSRQDFSSIPTYFVKK